MNRITTYALTTVKIRAAILSVGVARGEVGVQVHPQGEKKWMAEFMGLSCKCMHPDGESANRRRVTYWVQDSGAGSKLGLVWRVSPCLSFSSLPLSFPSPFLHPLLSSEVGPFYSSIGCGERYKLPTPSKSILVHFSLKI